MSRASLATDEGYLRAGTTIAARATAQGAGAIAIVRLSGPLSKDILEKVFRPASGKFAGFRPRVAHHGHFLDQEGNLVDEVLAVFMPGPSTYTGEDCAEIHCHGSPVLVSAILETLFAHGALPARPGEFSLRAFLSGRMDLSQAEAVAELVSAPTKAAARTTLQRLDGELGRRVSQVRKSLEDVRVQMSLAVDFPEDEVEILSREEFAKRVDAAISSLDSLLSGFSRARLLENGASVVLAGAVNAGKSSLLNALSGRNRALVTEVAGTTRDFLEERVVFGDLLVRLVDTAGVRESEDAVESLGIERAREQMANADCLLLVTDGAALGSEAAAASVCPDEALRSLLEEYGKDKPVLVLWNKADLAGPKLQAGAQGPVWCPDVPFLHVSAKSGENLDRLCETVVGLVLERLPRGTSDVSPNDRQAGALTKARENLLLLSRDIAAGQLYDLLSVHLDTACAHLDEVVGVGTPEEVLRRVFENFCIGK